MLERNNLGTFHRELQMAARVEANTGSCKSKREKKMKIPS